MIHYRVVKGDVREALCGSDWVRLTSIVSQVECEQCKRLLDEECKYCEAEATKECDCCGAPLCRGHAEVGDYGESLCDEDHAVTCEENALL